MSTFSNLKTVDCAGFDITSKEKIISKAGKYKEWKKTSVTAKTQY